MHTITKTMLKEAVIYLNSMSKNKYKICCGPLGYELVREYGEGITKISYEYSKPKLFEIIQVILAYVRAEQNPPSVEA